MIPVFFLITLIIVFLVTYESRKNARNRKQKLDAFWEKEFKANTTPKQDISTLDFITIPAIISSPSNFLSEEITDYENKLADLSDKKIVNLTDFTNTELKLKYGAPNFPLLSEYDANYLKLVQVLQRYAASLIKAGDMEKATEVLKFGSSIAPDVHYFSNTLAEIS